MPTARRRRQFALARSARRATALRGGTRPPAEGERGPDQSNPRGDDARGDPHSFLARSSAAQSVRTVSPLREDRRTRDAPPRRLPQPSAGEARRAVDDRRSPDEREQSSNDAPHGGSPRRPP